MTDIPADTSTTATISVGGTVTGSLEVAGDRDWYAINLTAGQTIVISEDGSQLTPDPDSYLNLRDSSGNIIAWNDDAGGSLSSAIYFQVTTSGTYYIDAGAWDLTAQDTPPSSNYITGTYTLSVSNYTAPPVYTYDQIANQLTTGYWNWDGEGAHRFNVTQGGTITVNISTLTSAEQALARAALADWHDIIGVNFKEVTTGGQIVFSDKEDPQNPGPIAQTTSTSSGGFTTTANVDISTSWVNTYGTGLNTYSFQTYIHEIGHALGLGHAGDYNNTANYATDAIFANDSWATSVMSYFSQTDNFYFQNQGFSETGLVTPMDADIVAMQSLYGLSTTTRTGDTTYGFNSTADNPVYNASVYPDVAYTIYDSGGNDTLDYSGFSANQSINLNPETFMNIGGDVGNVMIARGVTIENAKGGSGDDTIIGNGVANTLNGGAGNDYIDGGAGADTMIGGTGNDTYVVDNAGDQVIENTGEGTDTVNASISYTLGANVENLTLTGSSAINGTGNTLDNVITGNSAANVLNGGAGADTMIGGAGNDTYYVDNAGDVVTENPGEGTDTVNASISYTLGANVETLNLTGSAAINGTGNSQDNYIIGNGAANVLTGGAGNDHLNGGAGADTMIGGTGNDVYYVDNVGDVVTENLNEGTDTVVATIDYTLAANVENLTLSGAAVNGTGNALNNTITGDALDNNLMGGAGTDTLYGGAGNDTLDGGAGSDHMYGGAGNDTYYVDSPGDSIGENPGEGTDTVYSTASSYTLSPNVENLILSGTVNINGTGSADDNNITGNSGDNYLQGRAGNDTLIGGAGNDHLDGGTGADTMTGGLGNDIYYVDNAGDVVTENPGEGTDTVVSTIAYTLGANVENLNLSGSASVVGLNGTGNELNNFIQGTNGDNVLSGLGGNDTLYSYGGNDTLIGGDGNDRLDGGTGADSMTGGLGNDTYIVDNVGDVVTENANEGTDSVQASISYTLTANVEYLTLIGTSAINGTGNGLNNLLVGNASDNILSGLAGNDTINGGAGNDTLIGGAGTDHMTGGVGNDTFVFANGDFGGATTATADEITDFTSGQDTIDLSQVDANSLLAGDQAFSFIGTAAFSDTAGELRYEQISGNTYIEGDTNGDGIADFMIKLDGLHALASNDFGL